MEDGNPGQLPPFVRNHWNYLHFHSAIPFPWHTGLFKHNSHKNKPQYHPLITTNYLSLVGWPLVSFLSYLSISVCLFCTDNCQLHSPNQHLFLFSHWEWPGRKLEGQIEEEASLLLSSLCFGKHHLWWDDFPLLHTLSDRKSLPWGQALIRWNHILGTRKWYLPFYSRYGSNFQLWLQSQLPYYLPFGHLCFPTY